jgi:formylglycine-generating enzyme required for sulfatase activity
MGIEELLFWSLPLWAAAAPKSACPADMVPVEGLHHEQVQRICDDYRASKCWSFLPGLVMLEPRRTPIRACMDRYEWPNKKGATPEVMVRFVEAEQRCTSVEKRLCSEFEWELACEGPRHLPWPYGWAQEPGACNSDKPYRAYSDKKISSSDAMVRAGEVKRLWQGAPSGSHPRCVSPFGAVDLVGNVEEWVSTSRPEWPFRSSLKGGYWSKAYSGCRGTNERHGPRFRYYEIGFRCCKDPR